MYTTYNNRNMYAATDSLKLPDSLSSPLFGTLEFVQRVQSALSLSLSCDIISHQHWSHLTKKSFYLVFCKSRIKGPSRFLWISSRWYSFTTFTSSFSSGISKSLQLRQAFNHGVQIAMDERSSLYNLHWWTETSKGGYRPINIKILS